MHKRLAEIIAEKKSEVARLKKNAAVGRYFEKPVVRDFKAALWAPPKIRLIAEIKFASPSAGVIRERTDPTAIGRIYEQAGAAAISLLTDKKFFQGDLKQMPRLKKAVGLPILRKDFIIDAVQIQETSAYGADAVLLIARILSRTQLAELISACRELGPTPLIEIHDRGDLEKAFDGGAEIIGINNRDLDSFRVNIDTTFELAPLVPDTCILVSESGINSGSDIRSLKKARVNAVLVGSALMKSRDLSAKTAALAAAGKG